ncbi:O-antigen ligase family protein [Gilvimarinus sp. F26214L]|uniref:O-antigen ligase family protein n=1 Tax=Gilvimarinus sp. DZF01 TaxID=3461371 RepID=UPI0040456972
MDTIQDPSSLFARSRVVTAASIWIAVGLAALISLPLLPVGNYATLVYWLFYAPLVALLATQWQAFTMIWRQSDVRLRLYLGALLLWLILSASWSEAASPLVNVGDAFRHGLLIVLFLAGIRYLREAAPGALQASLLAAICIVAVSGVASMVTQYYLDGTEISTRLGSVGIPGWRAAANEVVSGIYFGMFGVLAAGLLLTHPRLRHSLKLVLIICAVCCWLTMFATGTRTAIVAVSATALAALAARGHVRIATVLLFAAALGAAALAAWPESEFQEFWMRGGLGSWRPEIWAESMSLAVAHLPFGAGLWNPMTLEVMRDGALNVQNHSHNFYLQLLFWSGIPGLGLYLATLARGLRLSLKGQGLQHLGFYGLCYFSVVQVFDVHDVFTTPSYYWPCLWLPLALGASPGSPESRNS